MFVERTTTMTNSKKLLLLLAGALIVIGLLKPDLGNFLPNKPVVEKIVVVTPPQEKELRDKCKLVIDALVNGSSDRKKDGVRLSELYMDLSTLIELDGEDQVIKTTEEIRQANSLSGVMLRLDIKGKYPGLSDATQAIIASQIGNDIIPLDADLRTKAVDAFKALSWACNEGSK
jgi:hypothetical protein